MDEHQAGAQVGAAFERSLKASRRSLDAAREPEQAAIDPASARLMLLAERMGAVVRDLPDGVDLFDTGFLPGPPPRYWVDMLSFVEMARDNLTYRFLQDSRVGRTVITETTHVDSMVDAVTAYIAQRLLERERQMAELQARHDLGAPPSPYASPYAAMVQPAPQPPWQAPAAFAQPVPQPVPFQTPQGWPVAPQNDGMYAPQQWSSAPQPAPEPPAPAKAAGGFDLFGFGRKAEAFGTAAPAQPQPQPLPGGEPMAMGATAGISYRMAGLLFLVGIAIGAVMIVAFALSAGR